MKNLTGWVFVYNEYTEYWQAARREDYNLLWNVISSDKVLKSKKIETLIEIIIKTEGNFSKIKRILK
jgi:hypothetical protein